MYFLIAIILGLLIGFLRRGSIRAIWQHPYHKWLLGLIGLSIMAFLNYSYYFSQAITNILPFIPIFNFVGYLFLLLMFIFNLDDVFSILVALGLTLDFVVIFINGGLMPVAETIIEIMPQNAPLTQSITSGTNVVFTIMQPGATLLSVIGLILPIPYFADIAVLLGSVPGLSIGRTFILVGVVGLVQGAMKLPVTKKEKQPVQTQTQEETPQNKKVPVENEPETQEQPAAKAKPAGGRFDSRTEEIFFEENPLPKDPLDKIFSESAGQSSRVKPVKDQSQTNEFSQDDLDRDIEMLTRPLGTGIVNSKEIRENLAKQPKEEQSGFFTSEFLKEKGEDIFGTNELFNTEPPVSVKTSESISDDAFNQFIGSIEDEAVKAQISEKIKEILEDQKNKSKATMVFESVSEKTESEQTEETKIIETEPLQKQETPEEAEEQVQKSDKTETIEVEVKTPVTFEDLTESIETETEEDQSKDQVIEEPEFVGTEEIEEVLPVETETIELEPIQLETEEIEEENKEPEPEEIEVLEEIEPVKTAGRKRKKMAFVGDLDTSEEESEKSEETQEPAADQTQTEVKPEETVSEGESQEKATEAVEETPQAAQVEPEEDKKKVKITFLPKSKDEDKNTEPETESDKPDLEQILELSSKIFDSPNGENSVTINGWRIEDLQILEDISRTEERQSVSSTKRGEFIQDEGSGYFVNKAYKEEKANMDRSEEEMLNVWAQVSKENEDRKLNRRKQASRNYQTNNPYREHIVREEQEAQERENRLKQQQREEQIRNQQAADAYIDQTAKLVNEQPGIDVKTMTDEERRAAGYEHVTVNMNGKTLSFWQKKN